MTGACALQDPKLRPSAKYLMQHKFVVSPRTSSAATALLPLVKRSREALAAMAASVQQPAGGIRLAGLPCACMKPLM